MYRVGYRTASFGKWSPEEAFRALGEAGCDSVELCLEQGWLGGGEDAEHRARELVDMAEAGGVRIHSVSFHGDGRPWPERAQGQVQAVRAAELLGVNVVVVNTPAQAEGVGEEQVVEHLCRVAEEAEGRGIRVAVEPEPELIIADVADALRVIDRCGTTALGVNLDVGHAFLTEADLPSAIRALAGRIYHVHLEDMPADEHRHLVPGEGDIDLPGAVVALWEAGFRGVLTIDLFAEVENPVDVAARAIRATRDVLREAMARVAETGGRAAL